MSQAESVDKRWYSRRYEEDASWFTARPVDVSPSWNDVRFRHWFRRYFLQFMQSGKKYAEFPVNVGTKVRK